MVYKIISSRQLCSQVNIMPAFVLSDLRVPCHQPTKCAIPFPLGKFTRMVVHGQLVEPAICLSDLYDVFLLDIVRDTSQNLWTMIYRSQ